MQYDLQQTPKIPIIFDKNSSVSLLLCQVIIKFNKINGNVQVKTNSALGSTFTLARKL